MLRAALQIEQQASNEVDHDREVPPRSS
jgi:hypothetical protein